MVGDPGTLPETGRYSDCNHTTIVTTSVKLAVPMIVKQKNWMMFTDFSEVLA